MTGILNKIFTSPILSTPMTLWDSPPFRVANKLANAIQIPTTDREGQTLEVIEFFRTNNFGYAVSTAITLPIGLTKRFTFALGESFFHTTTVWQSFEDMDVLGKAASFVSGLAALALGDEHPLVELIDSGKAGIEGAIFFKHIPSLWKLDFMNMWDDKTGAFIFGKVLKSVYPLFFQTAHLCAGLSYLQKCGFVNYAHVVASIGTRFPILAPALNPIYEFGLSNLKNYAVVGGAVIAVASVVEVLASKATTYRDNEQKEGRLVTFQGFLDSISPPEEVDLLRTALNNLTKAYVVYASTIGKWSTTRLAFVLSANLLGVTNLLGGVFNTRKDAAKVGKFKGQLAGFFDYGLNGTALPDGGHVELVNHIAPADNFYVGG